MATSNNEHKEILQRISVLETSVSDIISNHLKALDKKIDTVDKKVNWMFIILVANLASIVATLISSRIAT